MSRGWACYTCPMDALALYRQGRYPEALALAYRQGEAKSAALTLLMLRHPAPKSLLQGLPRRSWVSSRARVFLIRAE